jgi:toxin ParE1/3/4
MIIKVVWTQEALNRLIEIEEYISIDNPERAVKFVNNLINKGDSIAHFPKKGRIVPEFSIPEIREIIEKKYRIVYRIKNNRIEILTVFESHQLIRRKEI